MIAWVEGISIENNIVDVKFRMEDVDSKEWCCVIHIFENVSKRILAVSISLKEKAKIM